MNANIAYIVGAAAGCDLLILIFSGVGRRRRPRIKRSKDQKIKISKDQKIKRSKDQKIKRSKDQKIKRSKDQKIKRSQPAAAPTGVCQPCI
jgi:hypothetical protein